MPPTYCLAIGGAMTLRDWALLAQSRLARLAYWLCRERDLLGLPWQTPDLAWLAALPALPSITQPAQQLTLLAA